MVFATAITGIGAAAAGIAVDRAADRRVNGQWRAGGLPNRQPQFPVQSPYIPCPVWCGNCFPGRKWPIRGTIVVVNDIVWSETSIVPVGDASAERSPAGRCDGYFILPAESMKPCHQMTCGWIFRTKRESTVTLCHSIRKDVDEVFGPDGMGWSTAG